MKISCLLRSAFLQGAGKKYYKPWGYSSLNVKNLNKIIDRNYQKVYL